MTVGVALLTPELLAKLRDQAGRAETCPSCGFDPVLVLRGQTVEIYSAHTSVCRPKPVLSVVPGGEPA
jgi:hypothetical protein